MQCRQFLWLISSILITILFAVTARASFFSVSTDSEKNLPISLSTTGISFVSEAGRTVEVSADDVIRNLSQGMSQGHPDIIFISQDPIHGQACSQPSCFDEGKRIALMISDEYQLLQGILASLSINNEPVISPTVLPYLYAYIFSHLPATNSYRLKKLIRQALQRAMAHYLLLTANTDMAFNGTNQTDKAIRMWLLFVYWLNQLAQGTLPPDSEIHLVNGFNAGLEQNAGQVTTQSINRLFNNALEIQKLADEAGDFIANILLREIAVLRPERFWVFFINDEYGTLLIHQLSDKTYVVVTPDGLAVTVIDQAALKQLFDKIFGPGVASSTGVSVNLRANMVIADYQLHIPALTPANQVRRRQEPSQMEYLLAAARGTIGTAVGGAVCIFLLSRTGVAGNRGTLIGLCGGVFIGLLSMVGTPLDLFEMARFLNALRLLLSESLYRSMS